MTKLDRCWKNCLRLWKWVSENWTPNTNVATLKPLWLKQHKFKKRIIASCFFCQYAEDHGENNFIAENGCPECPGALVDARFKCGNIRYSYQRNPKAFYAKLLKLDAKRKLAARPGT